MLRCAIVEDSPRELEHLKECLARYSAEHFAQQVLDAYQQAIALKQYESEHKSILSWV